MPVLHDLDGGPKAAVKLGELLLRGKSLGLWQEALRLGPAAAMEMTLTSLRIADDSDPANNVVWARAADLVGAPRKHMRLLGLSSRSWPRGDNADPLLPDHVLNEHDLVDLPRLERDRLAFEILASHPASQRYAVAQQALGRRCVPRQERVAATEGRASVLFRGPERQSTRSARGTVCWLALRMRSHCRASRASCPAGPTGRAGLEPTPHDGGFRKDHPAVLRALNMPQSATSLRRLLRDPVGLCVASVHWG